MLISIVIVTFNSVNELESCLAPLPDDAEVIVVDQGSDDGSAAEAGRLRRDARVIVADVNRGFGAGCNLGAQNAHGEVLIFLNPDMRVPAPALRRLASTVASTGGSLVGPTLFDDRGNRVTRFRRWSAPVRDPSRSHCLAPAEAVGAKTSRPPDPIYAAARLTVDRELGARDLARAIVVLSVAMIPFAAAEMSTGKNIFATLVANPARGAGWAPGSNGSVSCDRRWHSVTRSRCPWSWPRP